MKYKEDIKLMCNKRIKKREFKVGDWVLHNISRTSRQGKLDENWKAQYSRQNWKKGHIPTLHIGG